MAGMAARLGHVLGWVGNGIAILFLIIAISIAAYQAWSVLDPKVFTAYEIETPDGKMYDVVGNGHSQEDALAALKKHLGEKVEYGPYGEWKVFASKSRTPEQEKAFRAATDRVRSEKISRLRADALETVMVGAGLSAIFALGSFLLGRAFRYVLSGPRK